VPLGEQYGQQATVTQVLASTEPHRVGTQLSLAAALLDGATFDSPDAGMLLSYADRTVGAVVLHGGEPESPVLHVARTLAELIEAWS